MKRFIPLAILSCIPIFGNFCEQCYDDQFKDVWPELHQCQFYDLLDTIQDAWEDDDIQKANINIGLLILLVNDGNDE